MDNKKLQFYIDGKWVDPAKPCQTHNVINPATEQVCGVVSLGTSADVDLAVEAAKNAFESWSQTTPEERAGYIDKFCGIYQTKLDEMAETISMEMGAPMWLAKAAQAPIGLAHMATAAALARSFKWEEVRGTATMRREPAGVVGMITPWNWPINQIACKVGPALAAGCTMVLKPSEFTPLNAILFTQCLHEAGLPAGVFNLVIGDGPTVGAYLSKHPGVDMMSFTGSTRAGVLVSQAAAPTVKRVSLELGGKSPNIITPTAPLQEAITQGLGNMFSNSGQSCNAPSRMLIHKDQYAQAIEIAKQVASGFSCQDPKTASPMVGIGPLSNAIQFKKVTGLIEKGIAEGATVIVGGPGRAKGFDKGYFVTPTVFANVNNQMTIAREEIFGPVLVMIPYNDIEEAIKIANDTDYGLSGYVYAGTLEEAGKIARRIRAGNVHLNGAGVDTNACFGGYKMSGLGREWGVNGLEEFTEVKGILGEHPKKE